MLSKSSSKLYCLVVLLTCCLALAGTRCVRSQGIPPLMRGVKTIVCLGDSITDGQTWSLILQQALRDAGKPVPICIAGGIGGDTSQRILNRLDRDVLHFHPDMVILNIGINDCAYRVKSREYAANLAQIIERLQAAHCQVVLTTLSAVRGYTYREDNVKSADEEILQFDGADVLIRRAATHYGCPLAEVSRVMDAAPKGMELWAAHEGAHLNYDGFRYMTRAILDVLGYSKVPIPETFAKFVVPELPGVIHQWRIRPVTENNLTLEQPAIAHLKLDACWKPYRVPDQPLTAPDAWWFEQERRQGFAISLRTNLGTAREYWGYAEVKMRHGGTYYVNTGGELQTVWVNGVRLSYGDYVTGWHAGGHRIPVLFKRGKNTIVIVTGEHFFCSVTSTEIF